VSTPGEVVQNVDRHPVPLSPQTAACRELQILNPQMMPQTEEESSEDAPGLDDDGLLREVVNPVVDSISTTPEVDAHWINVQVALIINNDADVTHSASVSHDQVAGDLRIAVEAEAESGVDWSCSQRQESGGVHCRNSSSREADAVSDIDNSAHVLPHPPSVALDQHAEENPSGGSSVQANDSTEHASGSTDNPHGVDVKAAGPAHVTDTDDLCVYVHHINVIIVPPTSAPAATCDDDLSDSNIIGQHRIGNEPSTSVEATSSCSESKR